MGGKRGEKGAKGAKDTQSFTIAGETYFSVNKVKSKARTILNSKKDGSSLNEKEESFIKELLDNHEKKEQKMKDFKEFQVGPHPDHNETRCFFVMRNSGEKEDFSISKCITRLGS
jgi:hypothetical protein